MSIQPVSDPNKMVTDPQVLAQISSAGMDKDFVEFSDYSAERPYSKLYTDLKSEQRILVSSGLPMVRKTDGSKLTPGIELSGGAYWLKNNLFEGYATGNGEFHISAVNDQPDGPIAGDESHFAPVLMIGGEVVSPRGVTLLENDPTNPNYHDNVIEWDYGVCKRRIRVIEGRFRGSWIFPADPGGDIRIEYNRTGRLNMRYGVARDADGNLFEIEVPSADVEFVPRSAWDGRIGGITVGDSGTFYPDPDPETATVDGRTYSVFAATTWANARSTAGTGADSSSLYLNNAVQAASSADSWNQFSRVALLFDTSSLPDSATITAASINLRGYSKSATGGIDDYLMVDYCFPASNTELAASDHLTFGCTGGLGTFPTYTNYSTTGYNIATLTAAGRARISKTGISKFGTVFTLENGSIGPTHTTAGSIGYNNHSSEKGSGYKPYLSVTYTVPTAVKQMEYYARRRRA